MKVLPMKTALNEIFQAGLENARLEVTFNGETIFNSNSVFHEMCKYTDYKIGVSEIFTASTAYFISLWAEYRENTKAQLYRAWKAMQAEYDPISNYDMREQSSDGRKAGKETETNTPHGGSQTTVNRYGIDSGADGEPFDKTTLQPLAGTYTETEKEKTHDKTITDNDGQSVSGYADTNDHYMTRSGNIGVTTSQQMLNEEIKVRQTDLLKNYVSEFIARYCYFVGGVPHDYYSLYGWV